MILVIRGTMRAKRGVGRIPGVYRTDRGLCSLCGYDLRASPECGAVNISNRITTGASAADGRMKTTGS